MKLYTFSLILIASLMFSLGCGGLDEDPCTFQKGEKVTVTSRFDDFAEIYRWVKKWS